MEAAKVWLLLQELTHYLSDLMCQSAQQSVIAVQLVIMLPTSSMAMQFKILLTGSVRNESRSTNV